MTRPLTEHSISMPRHEASVATARRTGQVAERRRCHDIANMVAQRFTSGDGYAAAREIARRIAEGNES